MTNAGWENVANARKWMGRAVSASCGRRIWSLGCAALSLGVFVLAGGSKACAYVAYADSANFTVNTAGILLDVGGTAHADSANFTINTLGLPPNIGGFGQAVSANFTLNTGFGTPVTVGGASVADSADFTVSTRAGTVLAIGGADVADSADFTVSTRFGTAASVGGVAYADSANFTVSTRFGTTLAVGGGSFADSADFTLNTTGMQRATPTTLGFALKGSSLAISWPTAAGSFSLQFTTNLNPPDWTTLSNSPATVGSNFVSTIATTNGREFFRLISN